MKDYAMSIIVYAIVFFVIYQCRPKAFLINKCLVNETRNKFLVLIALLVTALLCTLPMGISPLYNGKIPDHRNQYELFTESLLKGHLYIDYKNIDPKLSELENPYDPVKRAELDIDYHWDHAWYNNHYYMYFGVVPVFLIFLPYRIITGENLNSYHATQVFVFAFLIGLFMFLYELCRKFLKKISIGLFLSLAVSFSVISVWNSIGVPALYCTAQTAGICMEIWSIFFFFEAVYVVEKEKRQLLFIFLGSLFGALVFGCRPTIGLANIVVFPLLFEYWRKRKECGNVNIYLHVYLLAVILPYAIIGILLMAYNYVRFDSVFEFGQSYQLTNVDTIAYAASGPSLFRLVNGLIDIFISNHPLSGEFPYVVFGGVFYCHPILMAFLFGGGKMRLLKQSKKISCIGLV